MKNILLIFFYCFISCTSSSYDIIIINGQIADGSGNDLFQSNIYIKNEKIIEIGNKPDAIGKTILNAKGLIIAPGFIETQMVKNLTEETKAAILGRIPMKRLGKPEEIVKSDKSYTGKFLTPLLMSKYKKIA